MTATTATKATSKATKTEALSTITKALEQAHELIKTETGAPRATILVTRDMKGKLAHFTHYQPWEVNGEGFNEIAFTAEMFAKGGEFVLGVLLHEVAHSLNYAEGVKDCSANQYHNAKFKSRAESLGLKTVEVKGKGHAWTEITEFGVKRFAKALKVIDTALEITAISQDKAKPKSRNTNLLKATCPCEQVIRASRGVIEAGVRCDSCEGQFTEA
jgi:predicted SprT family Zn-dependent metalloprotease